MTNLCHPERSEGSANTFADILPIHTHHKSTAKADASYLGMTNLCHPERSEGSAFVIADITHLYIS